MHSKDKTDAQLCITFYNESFTELGGLMSTYWMFQYVANQLSVDCNSEIKQTAREALT